MDEETILNYLQANRELDEITHRFFRYYDLFKKEDLPEELKDKYINKIKELHKQEVIIYKDKLGIEYTPKNILQFQKSILQIYGIL